MASLLFIAPDDPGETVLATGVLDHAAQRLGEAEISVVCRPDARALFRALPGLAAVHAWQGRDGFTLWMSMAWRMARTPFDLVLDLDGSPAGYAIAAKGRLARKRQRVLQHVITEWSALVGAETPIAPKLWLDDRARAEAAALIPPGPLLVLAPGADAVGKTWPAERFAAVARRLVSGPLSGAQVAVIGAADDQDAADAVARSLDADGVATRNLTGALDLLAQAAVLEHATLFIGNDGAAMHLAAAMNAPTLGIFGASDERVRGPFGRRVRALRARDYEAIMALARGALDDRAPMEDVSVDAVEAAALDLLRAGGLT